MIHAIVHAADIQDRDGGVFVMATMFGMYPFLMKLYADGGYQGPLFRRAVAKVMARVNVERAVADLNPAAAFCCMKRLRVRWAPLRLPAREYHNHEASPS